MKINIDKFYCNTLLVLFILYYTQNLFFGSVVVGPLLAILIAAISFRYLMKILLQKKYLNSFGKIWLLFLCYQVCSYLISGNYALKFGLFQRVLLNALPFFAFYYFIKENILTKKHFIIFFLGALPLFILNFYKTYSFLKDFRNQDEVVVTAAIYMFIGLLPYVFMFKNKLYASISLLVVWFYLVQSNKKAALICGLITIVTFLYKNLFSTFKKFSFKNIILSIGAIIAVGYYSFISYSQNEYLQKRMDRLIEGGDDVRTRIAEQTLLAWYQSDNIFTYLFGLGFDATRDVTGTSSHNDVVDAITSYGIVGFFIYITIFTLLIKHLLKTNWNKEKRIILLVFIGIAFIMSLSSRWFTNSFPFMISMFLPYLLLTYKKEI